MQCNFVVDGNGAGAIPRMDKNAAIIGKFTLCVTPPPPPPQSLNGTLAVNLPFQTLTVDFSSNL